MRWIKLPEEGVLRFHNLNNTALSARGYLDSVIQMTNDVIDSDQKSQNHINHEVIDNKMQDII